MEGLSPWLSIWFRPKATIQKVVAENPNRALWGLAAIYGFCYLMNFFQTISLGSVFNAIGILLLAAVLSPVWGWINFSVWSWFVLFVGKWFKGAGNFRAVRAAYAWSCVPIILNIPLWLLVVAVFGHQLFLKTPDVNLFTKGQVVLLFIVLGIKVFLAIWSLIIYLNALAAVQSFSVFKAILNVIIAFVIMMILFFIVWNIFFYALSGMAMSPFMLLKPF